MPAEWRAALAPIGTNWQKPFLEIVPWIVVVFEQVHGHDPAGNVVTIATTMRDEVVMPGDRVGAGEVLFTVDDRAARAQLREAEAAIVQARAAIAEANSAQSTATRQLDLYLSVSDPAAVSQAEVIRAEGEAAAATQRLSLAQAQLGSAQARASSAGTEIERLTVRAPIAGEILAVNIRKGEFVSTQGGGSTPFIEMGQTQPLHVRIDIDEEQAPRVALGAPAAVSPRGAADRQVEASFVRAEPLVVPKKSLTNSAAERVDVRVLQVIYALPETDGLFRVGQQVDAFIPANDTESGEAE